MKYVEVGRLPFSDDMSEEYEKRSKDYYGHRPDNVSLRDKLQYDCDYLNKVLGTPAIIPPDKWIIGDVVSGIMDDYAEMSEVFSRYRDIVSDMLGEELQAEIEKKSKQAES